MPFWQPFFNLAPIDPFTNGATTQLTRYLSALTGEMDAILAGS